MATGTGRKPKSYTVRIRRRGIEITRTFDTKTEAAEFRGEMLKKIRDQADLGKKERRTLAEGIERYLNEHVKNHKSAEKTESNVRVLLPYIAGLYLDQIDEAVRRVKASTRLSRRPTGHRVGDKVAPLTNASINRRLAILRRVAKLAYDSWHWIDRPIAVELLAENNARSEYLSPDEIDLLAEACRFPMNHMVIVAAYTGMRRSEILGLTKSAIREDHIYLGTTKNGKPKKLPRDPAIEDALQGWLDAEKPDPRTLHKYFVAGAKKIGRPELHFHDLRHTAASLLLNAGENLATVADFLNCTIQNAQRYSHLSMENKRNAMLKITKLRKIGVNLTVNEKRATRQKP